MTRHFGSLLIAAAAVAGLAACSDGSTVASSPAATSTVSSAPSSSAPAPSHSAVPVDKTSTGVCPVSAATLNKAADLPDHVKMDPATVHCWKNWADADMINPPGDGIYLFKYQPATGWRYLEQGSAFDCHDLGIKNWDPKNPPPFCA